MSSPVQSNGVVNPPNLPSNPSNIYLTYTGAVRSALAVSRTNPSITYYLQFVSPAESSTLDGAYKIATFPDVTSAHAFVAGEMITL